MRGRVVRQRNIKQQQDSGRRGWVTEEMRSGISETGVVKQQGIRGCGFAPAESQRRFFIFEKMRLCVAEAFSSYHLDVDPDARHAVPCASTHFEIFTRP